VRIALRSPPPLSPSPSPQASCSPQHGSFQSSPSHAMVESSSQALLCGSPQRRDDETRIDPKQLFPGFPVSRVDATELLSTPTEMPRHLCEKLREQGGDHVEMLVIVAPGQLDTASCIIVHSPELESCISNPAYGSYDDFNMRNKILPRLPFGAQLFTVSTMMAASLSATVVGALTQSFPILTLYIGGMVTLSVVEGNGTTGFSGDIFDCSQWLQDVVDTNGGSETISDAISWEIAQHISFEEYTSNLSCSLSHLLNRYEETFAAVPKELLILGSMAPKLIMLHGAEPGPHPRLKHQPVGSVKVLVPATDADAMYLESVGCMLYSEQDDSSARQLFQKSLNVFTLE